MATLATLLAKLKSIVPDDANRFTDADKQNNILAAVRQYSKERPRRLAANFNVETIAADFAAPAGWVERFSEIVEVWVETDDDDQKHEVSRDEVVAISFTTGVELIHFHIILDPNTTLIYTTPHVVDGASSSVPDNDEDALIDLAGSILCNALASFYAENTDASLPADVIDSQAQANSFRSQADRLKTRYVNHMRTIVHLVTHFVPDANTSRHYNRPFHRGRFGRG